ncbi:MAG: PD-(D/E)XK nuclease family protein, partial [Deltaproteobacteria bacterium]|nr:PD-(D/E)XK nuclease family protein [Deltaproteobacteria bacterium]
RERREDIELPEDLIRDILPKGDFHLQEERRLFYVGMTRAMKELYLTSAYQYGGVRAKKVSQFVLEAMDIPKSAVPATIKTKPMEVIEGFRPSAEDTVGLPSIPHDTVLTLSYYQIDDYLTCPLKYKYAHILRVPLLLHHTIIYGNAIHQAVSTYFKKRLEGSPITLEGLIGVFISSWRSEGFITREHELQRFEAGKELLKRFYEDQEGIGIRPSAVERGFIVDLEVNRLRGRWDMIEERGDGPYIIDFKTSDVRDAKTANIKAKDSLQLLLYTLAYRECFKRLPAGVELHFLESGLVGRACFGDEEINKVLSKIEEVSKGIRVRDYTPRPKYLSCQYCAFNNICPVPARG